MPEPTTGPRPCVRCGSPLPDDRSVCPSCGTLQPARTGAAPARPRTIGPIPVEPPSEPGRGEFPGLPRERGVRHGPLALPPSRVAALGAVPSPTEPASPAPTPTPEAGSVPPDAPPAVDPAPEQERPAAPEGVAPAPAGDRPPTPPPADAGGDDEPTWDDEPRRRALPTVALVVLVAVLVGALALVALERGAGEDDAPPDDAVAAIRSFCDSPQALGDLVPAYDPAAAGLAMVQHPQPPSSTEPDGELVLQVAPEVGQPTLTLEGSAALVNVAVCLRETTTTPAAGTCEFELTNPDDLGEATSKPLGRTTYDVALYELRSAEQLSSGTLSTPTDACPTFAFTDGDLVEAPLTDAQLVAWVGANLPTA